MNKIQQENVENSKAEEQGYKAQMSQIQQENAKKLADNITFLINQIKSMTAKVVATNDNQRKAYLQQLENYFKTAKRIFDFLSKRKRLEEYKLLLASREAMVNSYNQLEYNDLEYVPTLNFGNIPQAPTPNNYEPKTQNSGAQYPNANYYPTV